MFIFHISLDFSDQPLVFAPKLTWVHWKLENGKQISYSVGTILRLTPKTPNYLQVVTFMLLTSTLKIFKF